MRPIWGEPFDPMRTGFDHMGLRVADPGQLDEWEEHFQRLDVNHTPTVHADYGLVLTFRDPDMRQYEMFYRAIHP
jgi:glyoxylase I family protein